MTRGTTIAAALFACVLAGSGRGARTAAAEAPPRSAKPLATRERFRQSLVYTPNVEGGVAVREMRRFSAQLTAPLAIDPSLVDRYSVVGLRVGHWMFQRQLDSDPRWRPGRKHARFRVRPDDPDRTGVTIVDASWSAGTLRVSVRSTSETPIADGFVGASAGPATTTLHAAARLGKASVLLAGTADCRVRRPRASDPGASAEFVDVDVAGAADIAPETQDTTAPVVTITSPAAFSTVQGAVIGVMGTVRDDRKIASVSWSLDDGAETSARFYVDPNSGYLDDARAAFSFPAPMRAGVHALRVFARDGAGGVGTARIDFSTTPAGTVVVPGPVPGSGAGSGSGTTGSSVGTGAVLRASKWGAWAADARGRVQQWGYYTTRPTPIVGISGALEPDGDIVLLSDGTATTMHGDPFGQNSGNPPAAVTGLSGLVAVAHCSTNTSSFALKSDGTVWAWGDNRSGQLGDGTTTSRWPAIQVTGLPPIQAISAGGWHAMALDRQGNVWTWGGASYSADPTNGRPRQVVGVSNAVQISASQFDRYVTGAAVLADGTLWMWGDETSGQLGTSVTVRERPAFQVAGVSGVKQVAMGYNHALVLLNDGTVLARGGPTSQVYGYWGEDGNGTPTPRLDFQTVPGLAGVVHVAAGAHTSHALLVDGTLRCWGQNTYGTVGDGTTNDALSPVTVLLAQ